MEEYRRLFIREGNIKMNLKVNVGLDGLGVTCSPRNPRLAGSNPAVVDEFFSGRKF